MLRWVATCALLWVYPAGGASDECGVPVGQQGRIIGGSDVGGYRYPWFAVLHVPGAPSRAMCAGTLVSARHVLTAAHCFKEFPGTRDEQKYEVSLGVYNRCQDDPTRQEFRVSQVLRHPGYTDPESYSDIAIMTLSRSASSFTRACLPDQGSARALPQWVYERGYQRGFQLVSRPQVDSQAQYGVIVGFGSTRAGDQRSLPCSMRQARVEVMSPESCKDTLLPRNIKQKPTLICAGVPEGGKDTCQGDSGGGLMVVQDGRYVVLGIVSFGYSCGAPGMPGLYTRVTSYLDWIEQNTGTTADTTTTSRVATGFRRYPYTVRRPASWWNWVFGRK